MDGKHHKGWKVMRDAIIGDPILQEVRCLAIGAAQGLRHSFSQEPVLQVPR